MRRYISMIILGVLCLGLLLLLPGIVTPANFASTAIHLPVLFAPDAPDPLFHLYERGEGGPVTLGRLLQLPSGAIVFAKRDPGLAWLLNTASNGAIAWESWYLPAAPAHDADALDDGRILLLSAPPEDGSAGPLVSWLDGDGQVLESFRYRRDDSATFPALGGLAMLPDGQAAISAHDEGRVWLVRLDANGNVLWSQDLLFSHTMASVHLAADPLQDGLYMLATEMDAPVSHLARLTPQGKVLWARRVAISGSASGAVDLAPLHSGGVAIAGPLATTTLYRNSTWAALFDGSGSRAWTYRYQTAERESAPRALAATRAGDLFLTGVEGYTAEPHIVPSKAMFLLLDSHGQPMWHTNASYFGGVGSQLRPADTLETAAGRLVTSGAFWNIGWVVDLDGAGSVTGCPSLAQSAVTLKPLEAELQAEQADAAPVPVTKQMAVRTRVLDHEPALTLQRVCPEAATTTLRPGAEVGHQANNSCAGLDRR